MSAKIQDSKTGVSELVEGVARVLANRDTLDGSAPCGTTPSALRATERASTRSRFFRV